MKGKRRLTRRGFIRLCLLGAIGILSGKGFFNSRNLELSRFHIHLKNLPSAVEGLKAGAYDYLTKPIDIDLLVEISESANEKRQKLEEKIRMAQARTFMKTPRDIIQRSDDVK